jgi:hypothetical protein
VVQEHILSPRTVSFSTSLFYDCRAGAHDEWEGTVLADRWHVEKRLQMVTYKQPIWSWISKCSKGSLNAEELRTAFWALWYHIIGLYTKSALTFSEDRSVALRGVVEVVKDATGWEYTCGIWHSLKLQSLLWRRAQESEETTKYVLPNTATWS